MCCTRQVLKEKMEETFRLSELLQTSKKAEHELKGTQNAEEVSKQGYIFSFSFFFFLKEIIIRRGQRGREPRKISKQEANRHTCARLRGREAKTATNKSQNTLGVGFFFFVFFFSVNICKSHEANSNTIPKIHRVVLFFSFLFFAAFLAFLPSFLPASRLPADALKPSPGQQAPPTKRRGFRTKCLQQPSEDTRPVSSPTMAIYSHLYI